MHTHTHSKMPCQVVIYFMTKIDSVSQVSIVSHSRLWIHFSLSQSADSWNFLARQFKNQSAIFFLLHSYFFAFFSSSSSSSFLGMWLLTQCYFIKIFRESYPWRYHTGSFFFPNQLLLNVLQISHDSYR